MSGWVGEWVATETDNKPTGGENCPSHNHNHNRKRGTITTEDGAEVAGGRHERPLDPHPAIRSERLRSVSTVTIMVPVMAGRKRGRGRVVEGGWMSIPAGI